MMIIRGENGRKGRLFVIVTLNYNCIGVLALSRMNDYDF